MDNLIWLDELSEEVIQDQIKQRYNEKKIYTYVGNILVSVNPYQKFPQYGEEVMKNYVRKGFDHDSQPPHIYALADEAYNHMRAPRIHQNTTASSRNQVIVIRFFLLFFFSFYSNK
mgnify:CR=1 FL=1